MCFSVVNSSLSIDEYQLKATANYFLIWQVLSGYWMQGGESKSLPISMMTAFTKLPLALEGFY